MVNRAATLVTFRRFGIHQLSKKYTVTYWSGCDTSVDKASLKAVAVTHAGDWFNAASITVVGLRLSDEAVRVTVGYRLGSTTRQPHTCICGTAVDARGLRGLTCRKTFPRYIRHSQLNDIIWRAVKKAEIPATKEPIGLSRTDGKRPDGATLTPLVRGKPLAWDVTVTDTYAISHVVETAKCAFAAATKATANKINKYSCLSSAYHFVPITIETGGSINIEAAEFLSDLGRHISQITTEPLETQYLFQRFSISLQRGNEITFRNTFNSEILQFLPQRAIQT